MSVKRYSEYKDSGVEWLGEVPGHWEVVPMKVIATCNDEVLVESTPENYEIEYVEISGVDTYSGVLKTNVIRFGDAPSRARRRVRDGDVIVSTVRTYLRAITPVTNPPSNMVVSTGFAVIRPRSTESRFLGYIFWAEFVIAKIIARSVGVSYPAINASELTRLNVPVPPIAEQVAIANFLDRETAKIDTLVEEQEKLIELLKEKRQAVISHAVTKGLDPAVPMKDSGIEWLGEVPEHWGVCKLGFRYSVQLGKMLDEKRISGQWLVPYLRNQDVQWGSINSNDLPEMDIKDDEHERYTIKSGDLLVCEGGDVGRAAIWRGSDYSIGYQKALHRVRAHKSDLDTAEFFYFALTAAKVLGVFEDNDSKTTISHLPAEKFRQCRFAFPPMDEQFKITTFLECETDKIDGLVQESQHAIALLKERRSALISAAVTGKIDVRELAAEEVSV